MRWDLIVIRQLAPRRLKGPLGEVRQKHGHSGFEFAQFALADVFDLIGDVFDIELGEFARAQEGGLSFAQATTSVS